VQYSLNPGIFTPIVPFSVVWRKQGAFSVPALGSYASAQSGM